VKHASKTILGRKSKMCQLSKFNILSLRNYAKSQAVIVFIRLLIQQPSRYALNPEEKMNTFLKELFDNPPCSNLE